MSDVLGPRSVRSLLTAPSALPRWALVCFPVLLPLVFQDECQVVDGRDLDDDEDVPESARQAGLTLPLNAEQVQDIVQNAALQVGTPTDQQLLDALNHYLLVDAFITFSGG